MNIDIPALVADDVGRRRTAPITKRPGILRRRIGLKVYRPLLAAFWRYGLWRRLVWSGFVLGWLEEFESYWIKRLGGRRLLPADFWYLYANTRQAFDVALPAEETPETHLATWTDVRINHLLFRCQADVALHPLAAYRYIKYLKPGDRVLEYGCGLAPISTSIHRYWPELSAEITLADIPTILWDFVQWKFCRYDEVSFFPLNSSCQIHLPYSDYFDICFCTQVLEHVLDPLAVMIDIHSALKNGKFLVVDYVRSSGSGLDSRASLKLRQATVDFLRTSYKVVAGCLPTDINYSIGTVILLKK